MTFDFGFALEIVPTLVWAARLTLLSTLGGFTLAAILGLLLAIARMNPLRPVRWLAHSYIEIVRNTPFLIQLYLVFYVLPEFGISAPALITGILTLGLNYSAYLAEVYRSGIEGTAVGQWEAAGALSLSSTVTWSRVIVPQAVRPVIPILGNYGIGMLKETPLLSTIAVIELFGAAQSIAGTTYRYYEPYTVVAVVFLMLSLPTAWLINLLEKRLNRHG